MELISHFNKFLSSIEPPQTYVSEASNGHMSLRTRLSSDSAIKGYIQDTFLSGSYARKTAVTPIKDVDVIVMLDINRQTTNPKHILTFLHRALRKDYPGKTRLQRRSIKVVLKYVRMDVVPAIFSNDRDDPIYIPDKLLQRWILTHPKGHIKLATELNEKTQGLFIPLVKAIKWWRNNKIPEETRPKSIILEAILSEVVKKYKIRSIPFGILTFFKYVIESYGIYSLFNIVPIINDPVLQGNNVAMEWTGNNFRQFIAATKRYYQITLKALDSPFKAKAVLSWRSLLGSKFPSNT